MIIQWSLIMRFWLLPFLRAPKASPYACVAWGGTLRKVA